MQSTHDLDASLDISSSGLQLCKALIASGDNLGQVSVEAKGSDFLDERRQCRGCDGGAQPLDEGSVLCQL